MKENPKQLFGFIPGNHLIQFFLVTILFLIWGIPNNLNDILIAQFMKSFELNRFQAGLVQSSFYMGYFILAIPAGLMMRRFSYKIGLITGLLLFALGCCLFYPAAVIGNYSFFLGALFVIAAGLTFLETGANIFIVKLGNAKTAERRLNFSQAFNPIGAVLGVLIGTVFILSGIEHEPTNVALMKIQGTYQEYLQGETMRVVVPYLLLGFLAVVWSILIMVTKFPNVQDSDEGITQEKPRVRDLFRHRLFLRGVLSQFLYCGAQTCTWSFFIQYVQDYTGHPERIAGYFLTGTLAAFGVGRFSATSIMKYINPARLMGIYSVINISLVAIAIFWTGIVGVWSLFLTSFFMSLMYPTNFSLSIRGLGANTKIGGSIMVMAIVGGAIFPPLMGLIAEHFNSMAIAMCIPLFAYIYIAWFAFSEHRQFQLAARDTQ